jgi:1-deoxy-D-xylulose-5-phosphate reductoisomerase
MKRVAVFGSTGAIGRQTLEVIDHLSNEFRVSALVARRNVARLARQAERYHPNYAVVTEAGQLPALKAALRGTKVKALAGRGGMEQVARDPATDVLVMGLAGTQGVFPVLAALRERKRVAIASKEIIVSFGRIVMATARRCRAEILPVDSELSAILQCLDQRNPAEISQVILTASGGPFRAVRDTSCITVAQALAHPTWSMGRKITVDSATMMNKGLEVIETATYFGIDPDRIQVLIHPQSIVHSLVEFTDRSLLAQLAVADMRLPIQYALTWPRRVPGLTRATRLDRVRCLEFEKPDPGRFPSLGLARAALRRGGAMPCILNAANEKAVQAFLEQRLAFDRIPQVTARTLRSFRNEANPGVERLFELELAAGRRAEEICQALGPRGRKTRSINSGSL